MWHITKLKCMREFVFDTERAFLDKFDGKIYAVSDGMGKYICDILEEDYITLSNGNVLIDMNAEPYHNLVANADSDYILYNVSDYNSEKQFTEKYGIRIIIKEKQTL